MNEASFVAPLVLPLWKGKNREIPEHGVKPCPRPRHESPTLGLVVEYFKYIRHVVQSLATESAHTIQLDNDIIKRTNLH